MVDGYGFDRTFHDRFMKILDLIARYYWRIEVEGIEHVPEKGGGLIVMNHAGTIAIDVLMVKQAIYRQGRANRIAWTLMADFLPYTPYIGDIYWRTGNVLACWENGYRLLKEKQLVIVCPEGTTGVGKHFSNRYQLAAFGKGGFARLAFHADVPIIPLSVIGSEEIFPIIYKNERLGRLLGFPFFPVTFTFPWLGLLGAIPLPSKWKMRFGPPLSPRDYLAREGNARKAEDAMAGDVVNQIETSVHELLQSRKFIFI